MTKAENLSADANGAHVRISVPINGSTYRRDGSVHFGNHVNGPEWRKLIGYGAIEDDSVKSISVYFYDETEGGIIHFDELKLWRFAHPPLWTVLFDTVEAFVTTFAADPFLGGYATIDEPPLLKIRHEQKWINEILSTIDINRPTVGMNPYANIYGYGSTIGTCDIVHNRVSSFKTEKEHTPNRAMTGTLYPYTSDMTFEMMRNQAWQVICHGATGVKVFSYTEMNKSGRLQWVIDLFAELADYEDIIMSVEPAPQFTYTGGGDWLDITTRSHNGKSYIFAVNKTSETKTLQGTINDETKYLTFAPLEVKLIEEDNKCLECGEFPCICNNDPPPGDDCCVECGEEPCTCVISCPDCGEDPCVCDTGKKPSWLEKNKGILIITVPIVAVTGICLMVALSMARRRKRGT